MKTLHTAAYKSLIDALVAARKAANLTQVEVAARLRKPQSYVAKVEGGERRLDVMEFVILADAVNADAAALVRGLQAELPGSTGPRSGERRRTR